MSHKINMNFNLEILSGIQYCEFSLILEYYSVYKLYFHLILLPAGTDNSTYISINSNHPSFFLSYTIAYSLLLILALYYLQVSCANFLGVHLGVAGSL